MTNNNNIGADHQQSRRHTQQRKPREDNQVLQTCRHSPPTSINVNENVCDKNLKGRTIGTDYHQSRHTQQRNPREAKQVLPTCRHSPPHSITVNENLHDTDFEGRTPEEGGKTEEEFEIFRREFMKDIVSSLNNDLGDGVATLTMDPDTGSYNIKFDVTISQSKLPVNGAHPTNHKLPSNNTLMSQSTTSPTSLTVTSNIQHDKTVNLERTPEEGGRKPPKNQLTTTELQIILSKIQEMTASFEKTNKFSMFLDKLYNHAASRYFHTDATCICNYEEYSKFMDKLFRGYRRYVPASDSLKSIKKLLIIQRCARKVIKGMETLITTRRSDMQCYNASLLRLLRQFCFSPTIISLQSDERYRIDIKVDNIRRLLTRQLERTFETPWWASVSHESNARLLKLVAEALTMLGHSNQDIDKTTPAVVSKSFSPTVKQIQSIQHFDFASITSQSFELPSESCVIQQTNYIQTRPSTSLSSSTWLLNSDGWMMIHDLKGWMKVQFLKGWLKCLSRSVKFVFHDVIRSMKLHDLTGWLKTPTMHTTMCTIELL
eukprot:scaffold3760_cov77-Cyclotella_meneghiniana.AAC.1